MSTNNEGTPTPLTDAAVKVHNFDESGKHSYVDPDFARQLERELVSVRFIGNETQAELRKAISDLTATRQRLEVALAHNEFLCDELSAFEWQRINAMSHAEVHKELLDAGYTQESLDAGLAKIRAVAEAAIAKRNAETAALHPSVDKAESNEGNK